MVHNKNFPKSSTNIATNNYFQKTKSQTAKRSLFETSTYNTTKTQQNNQYLKPPHYLYALKLKLKDRKSVV